METQALESYLEQMRDLILQKQENLLEDDSVISRTIDEFKSAITRSHSDEAFFEGEKNFYEGNYEKALKHYLEAKELPNFQFFCYRASSLISQERGLHEKALEYAQKAYKIDAKDPSLKKLYATLHNLEATQEIHPTNSEEEHLNHIQTHEYSLAESVQEHQTGEVGSMFAPRKSKETNRAFLESFTDNNELERRIQYFQNMQSEKMHAYLMDSERQKLDYSNNLLCILNGWSFRDPKETLLFTEESRKSNGGHYLRWNGKGIAINPGPEFMKNFHNQGFNIKDINFVIVTRGSREAYADVKAISELNQQLNKASPDRQIIHYYLHQKVYQLLASSLKPTFKQARNTIHKLEMFLDSPDVEKIELDDGITLHYFLNAMSDSPHHFRETNEEPSFNSSNLGIRFELTNESKKLKIGYLSGLIWSPLLLHHLGYCDLLLTGFGNTSSSDYSRIGYNEDSLGYFGLQLSLKN